MIKEKHIKSVELNGKNYELAYMNMSNSNYAYPQLMIDGKPIIALENYDGFLCKESIEAAEVSALSFEKSNGRYAYMPDKELDKLIASPISDCFGNLDKATIDIYSMFKVYHIVVESKSEDNYFRFGIYDPKMINLLVLYKSMSYPLTYREDHQNGNVEEMDSLIKACSMINEDLNYSVTFNETLKKIQSLLGQKYGDHASLFFSSHDEWRNYSSGKKESLLREYIKSEITNKLNELIL